MKRGCCCSAVVFHARFLVENIILHAKAHYLRAEIRRADEGHSSKGPEKFVSYFLRAACFARKYFALSRTGKSGAHGKYACRSSSAAAASVSLSSPASLSSRSDYLFLQPTHHSHYTFCCTRALLRDLLLLHLYVWLITD